MVALDNLDGWFEWDSILMNCWFCQKHASHRISNIFHMRLVHPLQKQHKHYPLTNILANPSGTKKQGFTEEAY